MLSLPLYGKMNNILLKPAVNSCLINVYQLLIIIS